MPQQRYFLGIVGNMGPAADEYFQRCVREALGAATDQEQISMAVLKNHRIPDRTEALTGSGSSPVPKLLATTKDLLALGVELIAWPCNTAHAFLPEVADQLSAADARRIVNMIKLTVAALPPQGAALLATTGTVATGIYNKECALQGKSLLLPEPATQQAVHEVIYRCLKQSDVPGSVPTLLRAAQELQQRGATHVILGCTELPLAYELARGAFDGVGVSYLDPMRISAGEVVERWRGLVDNKHPASRQYFKA